MILEYVILHEQDVIYFELSTEDQSEKEYEDLFEDDYFMSDPSIHFNGMYSSALNPIEESIFGLTPYLEIHSPPPES